MSGVSVLVTDITESDNQEFGHRYSAASAAALARVAFT